jgi:hypothetical protein
MTSPASATPRSDLCSQQSFIAQQACRAIPALRRPTLTSLQATHLLRQWASTWIDISATETTLLSDERYADGGVEGLYRSFQADDGGAFCWGTAVTLARLYWSMGFDAWVYAYGTVAPEPVATHAVTIVRVARRYVVQDGYFNLSLVDQRNRPLGLIAALNLLRSGRADRIRRLEPRPPMRRDVLYDQTAYERSVAGQWPYWLGNNWRGSDPRNMRSCVHNGRWWKCSVAVDFARFLAFYWERGPSQPRPKLRGKTPAQRVLYLMARPLLLLSNKDGWIFPKSEGNTETHRFMRALVAAS